MADTALQRAQGYDQGKAQAEEGAAPVRIESPIMLILAEIARRDDVVDGDVILIRSDNEADEG
jgi:hypothetical protein